MAASEITPLRAHPGQNQQPQCKMRDGAIAQTLEEGGHVLPRHGGNVLGLVAGFSEKGARLLGRLQINIETQRRRVFHAQTQAVQGFAGSLRFFVPDRCEAIPDFGLANLGNGHLSQLGEHMDFERTQPPPGYTVTFQFRLARLEAILSDLCQNMQVALGFPLGAPSLFDWVQPVAHLRSGVIGFPARFGQRNGWESPKAHFAAFAIDGNAQHPLAALAVILHQP